MTDEKRPRMNTSCHECKGEGTIPTATAMLVRGELGTAFGRKECPTCKGRGTLAGFVPPM